MSIYAIINRLLRCLLLPLFTILIVIFTVEAQDRKEFDNRTSLGFGLIQPVLGGFNVTYTKQVSRFVFAYSHGSLLNLDKLNGAFKSKSAREFNISQMTFITTGFDLGLRIHPDLSIRGEWKWHLHDLEHPDGEKIQFQTITIGPSVYYQWQPFNGIAKNLLLEFSVRWWPVVYSSLDNYSYDFTNQQGSAETFKHDKGDLFGALSIGWTFQTH